MTDCKVIFWRDGIDSWHASCSTHKWATTDGNFNRGEVGYLAEVHAWRVQKARQQGSSDGQSDTSLADGPPTLPEPRIGADSSKSRVET